MKVQLNALLITMYFSLFTPSLTAQEIWHVTPPSWWVGMKNQALQIMVHGDNIAEYNVTIKHRGVTMKGVNKVENPNYVFIDLSITPNAQLGNMLLQFNKGKQKISYNYALQKRTKNNKQLMGLNPSDFIYLIMPDRFANGDPDNDVIAGMNETSLARDSMFYRHGGDLQGITQKLDYVQSLGVTAVWLNPVLSNDQPHASYHGYAATDHYQIDPRFGGNRAYMDFIEQCHQKGMKVVMDIIHNHCGDQHWMIKDLPESAWLNQWEEFTKTTYRAPTLFDPYASEHDRKLMTNGWFDHHMPDLNQANPKVVNYLIQNNIWWIEQMGIDAFRMDTYAYSDPSFLEEWSAAIFKEYPQMGCYGETWVHGTPTQAYFHGQSNVNTDFNGGVPGLTDFQLYYALNAALNEPFGWTEGVSKLYYTLAKDYIYKDASRNVLFLDNHDLSRFYSVAKEDLNKYKTGVAFLMTMRGIPCMYYGTEILMKNFAGLHGGESREDFPGGWTGDTSNKFEASGRTAEEQAAFDYVTRLGNWRKNASAITGGKLMQFVPENGVYVYFRYNDNQTVMVIMNSNAEAQNLDTKRFVERMKGFSTATNVITGKPVNQLNQINVDGNNTLILELN